MDTRFGASLRLLKKRPALSNELEYEVLVARECLDAGCEADEVLEKTLRGALEGVCEGDGAVVRPVALSEGMAVRGYDPFFIVTTPTTSQGTKFLNNVKASCQQVRVHSIENSSDILTQLTLHNTTYEVIITTTADYKTQLLEVNQYSTILKKWKGIPDLVILLKSWCLLSDNASSFQLRDNLLLSLAVITCRRYYSTGSEAIDLTITFTAAVEELRRKRPVSCVVTKQQLTGSFPASTWEGLKSAAKAQLRTLPPYVPPVKCEKCHRGFAPSDIEKHLPLCRKCEKCGADKSKEGEAFTSATLKQHEMTCITCSKCGVTKIGGKRFTLSTLKQHEERCCVCQRCGAGTVDTGGILTKAQFEQHEVNCLRCSRCGTNTTESGERFTVSTVKQHEKQCIRCKKCGCTKIDGIRFTAETLTAHEETCCRCEYCFSDRDADGNFFTQTTLKAHEAKCTRCSKCQIRKIDGVRLTTITLKEHEKSCCICEFCGASTNESGETFTLATYKDHVKKCAKCYKCGTSKHLGHRFTPETLKEHIRSCCKCPYCGDESQSFTQDSLKSHIKTCMQCKRCNKNKENGTHFDKQALEMHEQKCLVCKKCGAVAGGSGPEFDASSLLEHEKVCLTCWKCQSTATEVSKLKSHDKSCTFRCTRCGAAKANGKRFTQQTYQAHRNICCRCVRCQATTEPDGTPFTVETHRAHEKSCFRCAKCGATRSKGKKFTLSALQEHEATCEVVVGVK